MPDTSGDRKCAYIGRYRWVRGAKVQDMIVREGMPEEIVMEGFEPVYGIHRSATKYQEAVMTKAKLIGLAGEGEAASHLRSILRRLAEGSGVSACRSHDEDRHADSEITGDCWDA